MTTEAVQDADVIDLWPDGPPFTDRRRRRRGGVPGARRAGRGHDVPAQHLPSDVDRVRAAAGSANGVGVIVVPGGGWTINAWTHEGLDVARWLAGAGYTAFLLKYRVQASDPDQAAFEAQMAVVDGALAVPRPAAQLPRAIGDLIATDEYLQARLAAADDGRRAIEIVRAAGRTARTARPTPSG